MKKMEKDNRREKMKLCCEKKRMTHFICSEFYFTSALQGQLLQKISDENFFQIFDDFRLYFFRTYFLKWKKGVKYIKTIFTSTFHLRIFWLFQKKERRKKVWKVIRKNTCIYQPPKLHKMIDRFWRGNNRVKIHFKLR